MNFVFFELIYSWVTRHINTFSEQLMHRFTVWVSGLSLVLVTIWVLMTGYRIMTGQLREPLISVITRMARVVIIISVATSMSIFGTNLSTFLTSGLSNEINQLITGSSDSVYKDIDKNLAMTEVAMSALDAVQSSPSDSDVTSDKSRASLMAMLGTAGPPMIAAVLLLMYQFAMALFVGFGPLFILCLMFDQTKSLFHRWLLYGVGTMFSLATLNVVTSIVLKLSYGVAAGMWVAKTIEQFTPGGTEGLMHISMEQGGIGMLLTLLIITVPPMAAQFFQGTLGSFNSQSLMGGADSYRSVPGARAVAMTPQRAHESSVQRPSAGNSVNLERGRVSGRPSMATSDTIKTKSPP